MKKVLLLLAALLPLSLPAVSHADISVGINVPGMSVHIGNCNDRGHYWDGYRWREPRWWYQHRPREYYGPREHYGPPPRVIYYGPPPRQWRDGPRYHRMPPPPPPGYYQRERGPRGPRW